MRSKEEQKNGISDENMKSGVGVLNQGPERVYLQNVKLLSHIQLFMTPWTVAYQAPPSMGFSRQEYWSGVPLPSPGGLPNPGIEPNPGLPHCRHML